MALNITKRLIAVGAVEVAATAATLALIPTASRGRAAMGAYIAMGGGLGVPPQVRVRLLGTHGATRVLAERRLFHVAL